MKRIIFSLILFLGFAATGFSQAKQRVQKTPEERAQKITNDLDQKLSLTPKQRQEIYNINLNRTQARQASPRVKGERRNAYQSDKPAAKKDEIFKVLDSKQRILYKQYKTAHKSNFKHTKKRSGKQKK